MPRTINEWVFGYDQWDREDQQVREALCTLSNGYWGIRGAAEEATQSGCHYPGTYVAGGYDGLHKTIVGEQIDHEVMVNWPNWLHLTFAMENGSWFDVENVSLRSYRQELDLYRGLLTRNLHVVEPGGRETLLHSVRVVHMHYPHLAAMQWTCIPLNWSGHLRVRSGLDGRIINNNVERYGEMNGKHFRVLHAGSPGQGTVCMVTEALQSHLRTVLGTRTRCSDGTVVNRFILNEPEVIMEELQIEVRPHSPVQLEKVAALYHSRDRAIFEPQKAVLEALKTVGDFRQLLEPHQAAWSRLWDIGDIRIDSRPEDQLMLRLYLFHLLQTASPHLADLDAGLPARGLAGELYQGHIFWDELFAFPFLNMRLPDVSRALLLYRSRRASHARRRAECKGYRGICYPWRSASEGSEQTPRLQWNPLTNQWGRDHTPLQIHQNAAIVYENWKYFQESADLDFLQSYGGNLILQIALLWSSMARKDSATGRYHIRGVLGPDEFHTGYPDRSEPGLDDNAYTNIMAVWTLRCAKHLIQILPEIPRRQLLETLAIHQSDLERWEDITRHMFVPFHDGKIISQFAGYEHLQEIDVDGYRSRYGDIRRLDRILEAEGDSINRYKISKQPDALMMCYLLPFTSLQSIFSDLGYTLTAQMVRDNLTYYQKRTTHGSTLSRIVFGWVLANSDRKGSWQYLIEALGNDSHHITGGSTGQGIHLGAMAGAVDLIQRCYAGISIEQDMLWLDPQLPKSLRGVAMNIYYRHHLVHVQISQDKLSVHMSPGLHFPININVRGKIHTIDSPHKQEFML